MWFDFLIAVIGFVIALYIGYRQLQARAAQSVTHRSHRLKYNAKNNGYPSMTNAVTVKNITFQEGEPSFVVPLIGKTPG